MPKDKVGQITILKHAIALFAFLLVVWGFYRLLFQLPDEVEELIIKPIIWLVPTLYLVKKEGLGIGSLGITTKNLFPSVYMAIGLGAVFAVEGILINYLKNGGFSFGANIGTQTILTSFGLSFATAVSEEVTFRGYLFNRVWAATGNEYLSNAVTSLGWALIHIPVAVFVWKLNLAATAGFLLLTVIFGIGASFLFAKNKNVLSPIFLHVLWQWPIILFR